MKTCKIWVDYHLNQAAFQECISIKVSNVCPQFWLHQYSMTQDDCIQFICTKNKTILMKKRKKQLECFTYLVIYIPYKLSHWSFISEYSCMYFHQEAYHFVLHIVVHVPQPVVNTATFPLSLTSDITQGLPVSMFSSERPCTTLSHVAHAIKGKLLTTSETSQ